MLGLSFFGRQKNRQFNYIPRYYDPKKEEWEERKRRVLGTDPDPVPDDKYVPGAYIRKARMNRMSVAPKKEQRQKTFVIRFLIVLCLLFALAYAIINSTGLQLFLERLVTK